MIDRKKLLTDLTKQVKAAEIDLAAQVKDGETTLKPLRAEHTKLVKADAGTPVWMAWVPEQLGSMPTDRADRAMVAGRLRAEYDQAFKLGRTAATWNAWLDERVTQVAVAWVLGTVFVRFCEDNRLIPEPYLAAAEPERRDLAEARYAQYIEVEQDPTFRGWLERAFEELGAGEAGKLLFNRRHNPLFQIPLSHDGARALVEFWRERDADDALVHDFTDPLNADGTEGWDTRFLGDLYQDLSEAARKTYALLQTPEFVEDFILQRTMDPVIREMGGTVDKLKMIDPTCGSGHFVLGAFARMLKVLTKRGIGQDPHERVKIALDAVHGVDLNPFAVAIARFRLLMAAMAAANIRTLRDAARYDWPVHLAVGDSLIKARQLEFGVKDANGQGELVFVDPEEQRDELAYFSYATEDVHEHKGILEQGRYDVVVGNPPYITVKDRKLNALYRDLYKSCSGAYALSVPFAERFFQLARTGEPSGHHFGMVGQITSNSFMKREFGAKLIEEYFAHKVELSEVIDTSGAYIPGHGTPTVILIGRRRSGNSRTSTIRTIRSVRGEPEVPNQAERGLVWNAITSQIDLPGSTSRWVSAGDLEREFHFAKHPWILTDGGLEMLEEIERSSSGHLAKITQSVGAGAVTREDSAYMVGADYLRRRCVPATHQRPLVDGTEIRDYSINNPTFAFWPYSEETLEPEAPDPVRKALWPTKRILSERTAFGKTQTGRGLKWFEYSMFFPERYKIQPSITFAFVATHNHFTISRSANVFQHSSLVINFRENPSEEYLIGLLGILGSSVTCFWLKQVCHDKGHGGIGGGIASEDWEKFYEFTGTRLESLPLPKEQPIALASAVDSHSQAIAGIRSTTLYREGGITPTVASLREFREVWDSNRSQMIALQEELDWQVYSLYNLHSEDLRAPEADVPELALGERAFEIVLARQVAAGEASGEWFKRHWSTPITELPEHWSDAYRAVVQKRIHVIETSRAIGMIERPEYKRRWATEGWDALQDKALRAWLLDRIEKREHWYDENGQPAILSRAQLTDVLSRDEDFVSVAEIYAPRKELADVVSALLADEHVPFLSALRYKPAALKKRADWEHVWDLQREEDAAADEGEKRRIRDSIPVPPKYTSADFLKPSYWRARGKLDVPKERFISYATGAISGTPELFGWAGWDHREQAQALAAYFTNHGELSKEEMTPLLAGLLELQPWLTQWHNEFDVLYSGSPAAFFDGYRATQQGELGLTDDDLRNWRPAAAARGRRSAKS